MPANVCTLLVDNLGDCSARIGLEGEPRAHGRTAG
jgi:hypothetical protein